MQAADHFKIGTLAILHLDVGGGELIDPLVNFFLGGEYGLQLLVRIQLRVEACNDALKRIVPRIDFNQINTLIDEVEGISEVRKRFYKVMLQQRYEKILMYAYRQL